MRRFLLPLIVLADYVTVSKSVLWTARTLPWPGTMSRSSSPRSRHQRGSRLRRDRTVLFEVSAAEDIT